MRLHELCDQVHAANLGWIFADLEGEHVHRSLDRRCCLRATSAAVCGGRCGVRDDRRGAAFDVGDVVHARRHGSGEERREDRAHTNEGACVLNRTELVVGDFALSGAADRDVLQLTATVAEIHHRLAACFTPAHWSAEQLGDGPEEKFFGIGVDLRAEAATDVRGDQVNGIGISAVGCDEGGLGALCTLARDPLDETTLVPHGSRGTNFEWARCNPLVHETAGDRDLAIGEVLVRIGVLGHAERRRVEDGVASSGFVDQRVRSERGFEVDVRRQELDVDEHHLGCVGGLLPGLGHDGGDWLAHVPHFVAGKQCACCGRVEGRRDRLEAE